MADSSSKLVKALFSSSGSGGNKTNFDARKINPRILKILGVSEFDIEDQQDYLFLLKEVLHFVDIGKSKLSNDDIILIQEELKRLRSKKFPKKKITADTFKKGTAVGMNFGLKKIKGRVQPQQLLLSPAVDKMSGKSDIREIIDALSSIIEQLTLFNNLSRDEQERGRRARENRRRREREGDLEKGFDGVMKAAEKIITPVKSILDRIINFLVMTLFGRSLILILRWFGDPENKKKVEAIGRFLGNHWPKLLALFVAFGTGLGGFVRGLIGVVIKGTGALIKGAFWLAKKAGIKGAAGALKFLGGPKGKLIGAGLELGAVALGTVALSKGLENFGGIGGEEETTPVQTYSGGGLVNFKNIFGNIGGFFGNMKKMGTDTIAAMLTPGEVVISKKAVDYWGADTLLGMNKIGGGDNNPKVVEGTTYAAGGGYMGDYMKDNIKMRPATIKEMTGESSTLRNLLGVRTKEEAARIVSSAGNKVPDVKDLLGSKEFSRLQQGAINKFSEGADEKTFKALRRIYQQHFGVGEEFSKMMSNRVDAKILDRSTTPKSKPSAPRIDPSRMLPAAGQSSANAMRAAAKAAQNVRPPIPTSSSIVPYAGGGLARTGVTGGLSVPQIRTNMNVPGGRIRGGRGGLLGTILTTLAEIFAPQLGDATGSLYNKMGIGIGNLSDAQLKKKIEEELKLEQSLSGSTKLVAGQNERLNLFQRESERRGLSGLKGGGIVGGRGLKEQSFKDAPKTQIMTDDKGKPFVGYKALRNGKLVYVRGSQPGTGTSNPLEALGRMLNPNAYKDIDAANASKKYDQAAANSISSLRSREASQATIQRRTAEIAKAKPKTPGITPPSSPKVNVSYVENMKRRRAARNAGGSGSAKPKVPSFSASSGTSRASIVYEV